MANSAIATTSNVRILGIDLSFGRQRGRFPRCFDSYAPGRSSEHQRTPSLLASEPWLGLQKTGADIAHRPRSTHREVTDHSAHEVDVAAIGVAALCQLHRPENRAGSLNAGLLVYAGAEEMEVMYGGLIADGHLVSACCESFHRRAASG